MINIPADPALPPSQYIQEEAGAIPLPKADQTKNTIIFEIETQSSQEQIESINCISKTIQSSQLPQLFKNHQSYHNQLSVHRLSITVFNNLKYLNLSSCMLVSIQPLTKLNAPKLSRLVLADNQIMTFRSIYKMRLRNLEQIDMSINYQTEDKCLWKCDWPELIEYSIERPYWSCSVQNLQPVAKLGSQKLKVPYFSMVSRINQDVLVEKLKCKWQSP